MKQKVFFIIGASALLVLLSGFIFMNKNSDSKKGLALINTQASAETKVNSSFTLHNESKPSLEANFNEIKLSEDALVNSSDLIVRGKILKVKERAISKVNDAPCRVATGNEKPEPAQVQIPYVIYDFKITENLSDQTSKLNNIDFVMMDANITDSVSENNLLNSNEEFILFLHKNDNNTYNLISYSQGLCKFKENKKEMQSVISNETTNYGDLKAKIAAHKK